MSPSQKFLDCHKVTAGWEGTWSNHPSDPGGKTMYGITEAVFHAWLKKLGRPLRPVRSITKTEALEIYFSDYWLKAGCETLFAGVDLATYDASVNSGVSRGRKWLVVGLDKANRHDQTVRNICRQRLGFVEGLTNWKVFGKGWGNRIADIEAKGVARALRAMAMNDSQVPEALIDEAQKAKQTAAAQNKGGSASGAAAAGSGATITLDPAGADLLAGFLLSGLLVGGVALAVWLFFRARVNRQRATAYEDTARQVAVGGAV
ncbi:MAG: secretion activator protein [Devosia sp.]|nr:secretion activator protein [Devosia sp.]